MTSCAFGPEVKDWLYTTAGFTTPITQRNFSGYSFFILQKEYPEKAKKYVSKVRNLRCHLASETNKEAGLASQIVLCLYAQL